MVYNGSMESLFKRRPNRACTYKAVKPYLSKPMPAIKLKYFQAPSKASRKRMAKESDIICSQCRQTVAVLGSTNTITGETSCDICAIEDYCKSEGFETRKAAEAHRRRLFDVGYLLTECLIDKYINAHGIEEEGLTESEQRYLVDISYELQNMIPIPKRTELHHTIDQSKIERYYDRLIDQWVSISGERVVDYF